MDRDLAKEIDEIRDRMTDAERAEFRRKLEEGEAYSRENSRLGNRMLTLRKDLIELRSELGSQQTKRKIIDQNVCRLETSIAEKEHEVAEVEAQRKALDEAYQAARAKQDAAGD
jgi:hypothetical protein